MATGDSLNLTGYKMTFADEFNSLSLWNGKSGTWRADHGSGALGIPNIDAYTRRGNSEKEIYVAPGFKGTGSTDLGLNPFSISNGVLNIKATKVDSATSSKMWGYQYASGEITTKESFSQQYGYFEMRAQLPKGQGFWPAFWLLPKDGSWPPELDVMEQLGNDPTKIYTTVHTNQTGHHTSATQNIKVPDVTAGMHNYGVKWDAKDITFYFDGKEVFHTATPRDMNKPMYMLANLAVGGSWPGNPNSSTPFPAQMKIDYIHAYQAGSGTPTPPTTPTPPATPGDLTGTNAHDSLIGTAGANKINGLGGDDWLEGKGGNDTLTGGAGYDTFAFAPGSGQDTVTDFGKGDKLYLKGFVAAHKTPTLTQSGADTVVKFSSGESITLKGVASGSLTHSSDWGWIYGNAASSAPPSTPTPPATPGTTITGTARNDALVGKDGAETIKGLGGDDWLEGKKGNDFLSGGAGHDTFAFGLGSGKDTITDFDPTQDKIYMKGQVAGGHAPSITQAGADTVIHFSATDVVTLKNVDMHGLQHSADGFWLT